MEFDEFVRSRSKQQAFAVLSGMSSSKENYGKFMGQIRTIRKDVVSTLTEFCSFVPRQANIK